MYGLYHLISLLPLPLAGCLYLGQVYNHLSEVKDPDDPCKTCQCRHGNMECQSVDCSPHPTCQHPHTPTGKCCPECSDCEGRKHGSTWKDSPCSTCSCKVGLSTTLYEVCLLCMLYRRSLSIFVLSTTPQSKKTELLP